jgi:Fe-S-cluster-containing dehydrogenase component
LEETHREKIIGYCCGDGQRDLSSLARFLGGEPMLANYGYKDASGDFFITIDTDVCNGCRDCVSACPAQVFVVVDEDPNDPMREEPVAMVAQDKRKKLKYVCNPCKPTADRPALPCVTACKAGAISHSW